MNQPSRPERWPDEPPGHQPAFNIPPAVLVLVVACVVIHLVRTYLLSADQDLDLLIRTALIPIRYSGQFPIDIYAFTSTETYALLHGGFSHLAVNMIWLVAVGSPLENRIGWRRLCLFWLVTAAAAAGAHYLVHPLGDAPLVGASGAISGMMAASVRYQFRVNRSRLRAPYAGPLMPLGRALRSRQILLISAVWMGGNLLVGVMGMPGVSDAIAWEAHIGGFLAGFLLIGLFDRLPAEDRLSY